MFDPVILDRCKIEEKTVFLTLTNTGYLKYTLNLLESLKPLDLHKKLLCVCIDKDAYTTLHGLGYNCHLMDTEFKEISYFNNGNFNIITFLKFYVTYQLLKMDLNVFFTDGDIVFKKNPFDYIFQIRNASEHKFDAIMQRDDGIEVEGPCEYCCTGFFFLEANEKMRSLFDLETESKAMKFYEYENDQYFFNDVIRDHISIHALDHMFFPNGSVYKKMGAEQAYIIHFNHMIGNNKFYQMYEDGYWYLPYTSPCKSSAKYKMTLREWQMFTDYSHHNILYNCSDVRSEADAWTDFPIGMTFGFMKSVLINNITICDIKRGNHETTVLCSFNPTNDLGGLRRKNNRVNRMTILETLSPYYENIKFLDDYYYKMLASYKFIISPEGNGVDCHRHYEALMAGCIPVVEESKGIREKYKGCPILFTKDYSEINDAYLEKKYEEMLDQTYDFSCLFLDSYDISVQSEIKRNGNYWGKKFCDTVWYSFEGDQTPVE